MWEPLYKKIYNNLLDFKKNFFSDNKDLQFHLEHPLMRKIVELKERNFAEKEAYNYAPQSLEDALDSYRRVMELAGEICGEVIAPNAEGVDHEGPHHKGDRVEYASGTKENLRAMRAWMVCRCRVAMAV